MLQETDDTAAYPACDLKSWDFNPAEQRLLDTVNQRIAAGQNLAEVLNYLFDSTREICPCDRIGVAFLDETRQRLSSYWNRALYTPLRLDKGYAEDLAGSSLKRVIDSGRIRIIGDLQIYGRHHPQSHSTRLLLEEGVRSNLTCPLKVDGRVVGVLFRSARQPGVYAERHIRWHEGILERLSQAVEKAYRIEQLTEANRSYLEMLAFVSHELKNPLATLVLSGETLLSGYLGGLTPEQHKAVERIARQGRHLTEMVREYLDLAQIEGGELKVTITPGVRLRADLIAPLIDQFEGQLKARNLRVEYDFPPEDPALACDVNLMRMVWMNLLGNAIKYGRVGGLIRISATVEGSRLKAALRNEGAGFRDSDRDRLFRRFSRLAVPDFKGVRGTGLGLYNSWRIVQAHKGHLTADSEYGHWAEFRMDLPGEHGAE
jgi:signal transduction histidine kinase